MLVLLEQAGCLHVAPLLVRLEVLRVHTLATLDLPTLLAATGLTERRGTALLAAARAADAAAARLRGGRPWATATNSSAAVVAAAVCVAAMTVAVPALLLISGRSAWGDALVDAETALL